MAQPPRGNNQRRSVVEHQGCRGVPYIMKSDHRQTRLSKDILEILEQVARMDREIAFLPAYSAFGIDSIPAAIFASRGVERLDSRVLIMSHDVLRNDINISSRSITLISIQVSDPPNILFVKYLYAT